MSNSASDKVQEKIKLMAESNDSLVKERLHNEIIKLFKAARSFWQFSVVDPKLEFRIEARIRIHMRYLKYPEGEERTQKLGNLLHKVNTYAKENNGNPGLSYAVMISVIGGMIEDLELNRLGDKLILCYPIYFMMHNREGKVYPSESMKLIVGQLDSGKTYCSSDVTVAEWKARGARWLDELEAASNAATAATASAAAAPAVTAVYDYDTSRLPVELEMKELNSQDHL